MTSVLPLIGIAALMVVGFVIWIAALTYDPHTKFTKSSDRAPARERRPKRKRFTRRAQQARPRRRSATRELVALRLRLAEQWVPRWRRGARELAATVRARAIVAAEEWWPRMRPYTRDEQLRWLIAVCALSLVVGYFIAMVVT